MTNTFGGAAPPLVVPRIKPTCATPVWPGDTGSEEFQGFFNVEDFCDFLCFSFYTMTEYFII